MSCPKIDTCPKIRSLLDRDMMPFQYIAGAQRLCADCPDNDEGSETRSGAEAARRAHNPEDGGSNPPSATIPFRLGYLKLRCPTGFNRCSACQCFGEGRCKWGAVSLAMGIVPRQDMGTAGIVFEAPPC